MNRRPAAVLAALAILAGFGAVRASAQPLAVVEVSGGAFSPRETYVDRGGTVRWVAREAGHTITADGCRANDPDPCWFDFPAQGTTKEGETYEWQAPDQDVTIGYHCEVHSSMTGWITVGIGSPAPSPSPTPPPVYRDVPSPQFPTIQAGVTGAGPNTIVRVASGMYTEAVTVTAPGITIEGAPDGSTVIEGENLRSTGIGVTANDVRVRDVTVQNFRSDGLVFLSVEGFAVERVHAVANKARGVLVRGSRTGTITDSDATRSTEAAFMVAGCADCDIVISAVHASASRVGYLGEDAGGVVLRRSELDGNSTGVLLSTQPGSTGFPQGGTHVYANAIHDNDLPPPASNPSSRFKAPAGVGVWSAGSWLDRIEANTVSGHARYGIAVSVLGAPAYGVRVTGNAVSASGKADLAWDGLGIDVCFSGNEAQSEEPPVLSTLYRCGSHLPAGMPDPVVDAELLPAAGGLGP
jgi:plastocyanin